MKKILLGVAGTLCAFAFIFSISVPAQASTLTSAQIQAIIGLLQSFGADQSVINNVNVALGGSSSDPRSCSAFADLKYGDFDDSPGGRVSQLQTWLGISSNTFGFGTYGNKTRAAWQSRCGGGTNNAGFSASPTYGSAPLAVTFTIIAEAGEYSVEFGDGQSTAVTMPAVQCFRAPCTTQANVAHTYALSGTYTAKLMYQTPYYCPPGAYCAMMMPAPKQVGTATITVTGGTIPTPTFSASPTSGAAPLTVTFSTQLPVSGVDSGTTYSVDFGDGSGAPLRDGGSYFSNFGHTYTSAGTYTVKLTRTSNPCVKLVNCYAPISVETIGTATITVTGGTVGGVPSINGLDAPTSLSVGQTGTWTVHASAPSGTQLRYSVLWGDEVYYGIGNPNAQMSAASLQTNTTFTHAYQNAGTYNPTFYVSNDYGSVQTSASVVVSGNTQTVSFSASPTSGTAPLAVAFRSNTGGTVNFGDGTSDQMQSACYLGANCDNYLSNHTYTTAGTYTAQLMTSPCPAGAQCYAPTQLLGSVTVTVSGGTTSGSLSAYPTYGFAPLGVVFTTNVSGALIDFGDGTSGKVSSDCATSLSGSANCNTGSYFASHTYSSAGTYTAVMKRIIGVREIFGGGDTNIYETIGTVTITVMTGWL